MRSIWINFQIIFQLPTFLIFKWSHNRLSWLSNSPRFSFPLPAYQEKHNLRYASTRRQLAKKSCRSIRTIFDQVKGRDYRFDGGNLISGCQFVTPILLVNTRKINRRSSIQRNRGWVLHTEISLEKKKEKNRARWDHGKFLRMSSRRRRTKERKKEKEICSKKREKKTHYFYISLFLTLIHRQD